MSRLLPTGLLLVIAASWPLAAQTQLADATRSVSMVGVAKTKQYAFTTIQGNALDSSNAQLRNATVRLRDARFGRIVDTQITDKAGLFAFRAVDPGSYIVEIIGKDESILAASQLLTVNAGDAASAVVRLPFRVPPFAGAIGGTSMSSSAAVIATQAVASSIVAVVPTRPVSPNQ